MKIHIVLTSDNRSWIIEKMAHRLREGSSAQGVVVTIGDSPDPGADINHWMSYAFADTNCPTRSTISITHLDDPYKTGKVASLLDNGVDLGICLSSHHRRFLIDQGVPQAKLCYVTPGHDFVAAPRRIVVGITSRVYPDGRKREHMLATLSRSVDLSAFRFQIFGSGWENVILPLQKAGALVEYFPNTEDYVEDYRSIVAALPDFDYYLYLGRDEGSLGTLDALNAGVKTIVTPQGFHCDLPEGITHAVWTDEDLATTFTSIATQRSALVESVASLSWQRYAEQHCFWWRSILSGEFATDILNQDTGGSIAGRNEADWRLKLRYFNPRRFRSFVSQIAALRPIRNAVLRRRNRI